MKRIYLHSIVMLLLFAACNTSKKTSVVSETKTETKPQPPEPKVYRASYTIYNDLVHTKLEVKPDWDKKYVYGRATITLHPHFYPTDSLTLNARGMDINEVSLLDTNGEHAKLNYTYTDNLIHIHLDKVYKQDEIYTVFIDYTSKPEELPDGGSSAIRKDKGFYFINADGKEKDKPKQFWTQGETESNSAWFPTIENPAQKMTQEIYITVDTQFTTVSNGLHLTAVTNPDGTRTDYWKQSLPAAPYLTMIAASDFAVVHDKWRNIEVNYYLDKDYEKYAMLIFGHTPEMLEFFSKKLGMDYPWEKFSQVVVHDFVSGAMENTTAVIHGTNMLEDSSEYMDGNYEDYIAHELFHHWFGDLVTCESWSNIALNESFANYSEYLWREYKFGRDDADKLMQEDMSTYLLSSRSEDPDLVRFDYESREDVYDAISYNKGGHILHMLRKYVGNDAFFASLKLYLETKKFQSAEVHDLRLAFEKVTGEDLNWFFNEWFLNHGHPSIDISYAYSDSLHQQTITIEQTQDFEKNPLYRIPLFIDIYHNGKTDRKNVVLEHAKETFTYNYSSKPDLINVDAEKILLGAKTDHKSQSELTFQYYHAPLYLDRFEALNKTGSDFTANSAEGKMMEDALSDKFWNLRVQALKYIGEQVKANKDRMKAKIIAMAADEKPQVRAQAVKTLSKYYKDDADAKAIVDKGLDDKSYLVLTSAFKIIYEKDEKRGFEIAKRLETSNAGDMVLAVGNFYAQHGKPESFDFFTHGFSKVRGFDKFSFIGTFGKYVKKSEGITFENGISKLSDMAEHESSWYVRYAAMKGLEDLTEELSSRTSSVNSKLDDLKKANSTSQEVASLENDLEKLKMKSDSLKLTITQIKSKEKEKRLKKMYEEK